MKIMWTHEKPGIINNGSLWQKLPYELDNVAITQIKEPCIIMGLLIAKNSTDMYSVHAQCGLDIIIENINVLI